MYTKVNLRKSASKPLQKHTSCTRISACTNPQSTSTARQSTLSSFIAPTMTTDSTSHTNSSKGFSIFTDNAAAASSTVPSLNATRSCLKPVGECTLSSTPISLHPLENNNAIKNDSTSETKSVVIDMEADLLGCAEYIDEIDNYLRECEVGCILIIRNMY